MIRCAMTATVRYYIHVIFLGWCTNLKRATENLKYEARYVPRAMTATVGYYFEVDVSESCPQSGLTRRVQ